MLAISNKLSTYILVCYEMISVVHVARPISSNFQSDVSWIVFSQRALHILARNFLI